VQLSVSPRSNRAGRFQAASCLWERGGWAKAHGRFRCSSSRLAKQGSRLAIPRRPACSGAACLNVTRERAWRAVRSSDPRLCVEIPCPRRPSDARMLLAPASPQWLIRRAIATAASPLGGVARRQPPELSGLDAPAELARVHPGPPVSAFMGPVSSCRRNPAYGRGTEVRPSRRRGAGARAGVGAPVVESRGS